MEFILMLVQFFSRIPVNKSFDYSEDTFKKSNKYLSLVGFIISIIPALLMFILAYFSVFNNSFILSLITLLVYTLITGAFHLDGLSDSVDGLFSGRNRERILEIMKDSRIGSYGTIALIFSFLFKFAIFNTIGINAQAYDLHFYSFFIISICMAGKYALSFLGHISNRAKEISSGNYFIKNSNWIDVIINGIVFSIVLVINCILIKKSVEKIIIIFLLSNTLISLVTYCFSKYCNKKIGGIVGDNLGFIAEVSEIIIGILVISI